LTVVYNYQVLIEKALKQTKIDPTEIEIYLSHLLGKDRSFIKAFPEYKLNNEQTLKFKEFIKRRRHHEPLAYILGYKEFCGLNFKIDHRAMVPRPETEELVRQVTSHVYALPNRNRTNHWKYDQLKIVDVGTGCGNIAIALAKAIPFAKIFAIEKDSGAYELAKENISDHQLENEIKLIQGDLLEPLKEEVNFIVANLPYIPKSRFALLAPEITKWEPRIALDGGEDGLGLYQILFKQAITKLKPGGSLFYEVDGQTYIKQYHNTSAVLV